MKYWKIVALGSLRFCFSISSDVSSSFKPLSNLILFHLRCINFLSYWIDSSELIWFIFYGWGRKKTGLDGLRPSSAISATCIPLPAMPASTGHHRYCSATDITSCRPFVIVVASCAAVSALIDEFFVIVTSPREKAFLVFEYTTAASPLSLPQFFFHLPYNFALLLLHSTI